MRASRTAILAACLALSACGGDDAQEVVTTERTATVEAPASPTGSRFERQARRAFVESQREARARKPSPAAGGGAMQRIVSSLPIRKPPLRIQQYITGGGAGHLVIARPKAKDFFCGRTPAERQAAVEAFYGEARKLFSRRGVEDFALQISPLADRVGNRQPVYALGRFGDVDLTKLGRGRGPC